MRTITEWKTQRDVEHSKVSSSSFSRLRIKVFQLLIVCFVFVQMQETREQARQVVGELRADLAKKDAKISTLQSRIEEVRFMSLVSL